MGKNPACAMVLVVAVAISSSGAEPPRAAPARVRPKGRVLILRVVERDGKKPVAGVAIQSLQGRDEVPDYRGTTDDQGRCAIPIPPGAEKSRHFAVQVWKDGYVPDCVFWGRNPEFEFEGVPAAYMVVLERGAAIGGVVRDEQGRPITGARVFPTFVRARRGKLESLGLPQDAGIVTDSQGRWRCAMLPLSCETGEMLIHAEHPRFVRYLPPFDRHPPIKDLRALTATIVMKTGFTLRGTVTDQNGKAIEGATVMWRGDWMWDQPRVKTGPDGRFQFENRPPGISEITAEVPGLAMSVKRVWLGPLDPDTRPPMMPMGPLLPTGGKRPAEGAMIAPTPPAGITVCTSDAKQIAKDGPCEPALVIRMGPGRTIRGRVVDTKGRPIAGARVTPEFMGRPDVVGARTETGADGRFQWTNAPLEVTVLRVDNAAEGLEVRCFGPSAQDGEFVVTMPAPFRLRGKVVDADSGRPIDRFLLTERFVWTHDFAPEDDDSPPDRSLDHDYTVVGGRYEVRFPRPSRSDKAPEDYGLLVVRIEAEGYAPATSRKYWVQEGDQTCDFALRKRPWIKGTVRAPDGSPVAGAEVIIAVNGQAEPRIYNGRLAPGCQEDVVRTGPGGQFGFAKPEQGGRAVVVSDRGLARRTLEELTAEPVVTLEPWGRIHGQLRVGTTVGAHRIVGAVVTTPDGRVEPEVSIAARALTDAEGRFLLDRVAPGRVIVFRPHLLADGSSYRSHRQGLNLASGQTAEVTVGGAGRPVVGWLTRAAGLPSFELGAVTGRLRLVLPNPEFPQGMEEWDADKQRAWWYAFYRTDAGRKHYERANAYAVDVESDGSFRIDDVPEGRYRLNFEYATETSEPGDEPKKITTKIAVVEASLDVAAGPDEKPLNLGTLTLTPPEPEVVDR